MSLELETTGIQAVARVLPEAIASERHLLTGVGILNPSLLPLHLMVTSRILTTGSEGLVGEMVPSKD